MVVPEGYDFSGWASKNDLKCADGRTIRKDAFAVQDGARVPLVWNHQHNSPDKILGHAILENRGEGVYTYGYFNNTENGKAAKESLIHGDIEGLSIWADNLDQRGRDVYHGVIREVSLVLAGANPGAFVESVMAHGMTIEEDEEEALIYTGDNILIHAEANTKKEDDPVADNNDKTKKDDEKSVADVFNTLNEEQKEAVAILVGLAIKDAEGKNDDKEDDSMKHNLFENDPEDVEGQDVTYLSHSDMVEIIKDARKIGSLREAYENFAGADGVLVHSIDATGMATATGKQTYGFNDASMLFPEARSLNNTPEWISRNMTWVSQVMSQVHRTPFSRIKSIYANITEDEARAKGYIKGKQKKHEVFSTLKRTTEPQTVYKLQKMDRDDVIDITGFDVIAWIKSEMLVMLNEEIARAILIGDGRLADAEDKIKEENIRPIVTDVPLFNVTVKVSVPAKATEADIAKATINAVIRSRKQYKGSGNPTFWTTEDVLTEMLLLEDGIGHKMYKTEAEVATALRVSKVTTVEPMEGYKITIGSTQYPLIGTICNLVDYNIGADKGGDADNMFEDFDINFNQMSYLIEKRLSGALIKPYSAITLVLDKSAEPTSGEDENA